ncbi:DUF4132 domain-containing protein [Streptomyces sp. NPDC020917]|uniref:DUF4132 domain-containing protein n=1 Tax=Streptomyces sp. NPDC020917 TaxID=3365102 RepID=UPI0037B091E0
MPLHLLASRLLRTDSVAAMRRDARERARGFLDLAGRREALPPSYEVAGQGRQALDALRDREAEADAAVERWLARCSDDEGRAAVLCFVLATGSGHRRPWSPRSGIGQLAARLDGWTRDEVAAMLSAAVDHDLDLWFRDAAKAALSAAERLDDEGRRAVAPGLRGLHAKLMGPDVDAYHRTPLVTRLRALLAGVDALDLPEGLVPASAPWAAALRDRLAAAPSPELNNFIRHLATLSGPRPAQRWQRACRELAEAASADGTVAETLRLLAEGEALCSRTEGPHMPWVGNGFHYHYLVHQRDADLARGVVWAAALGGGPGTARHFGALALRTGGSGSGVSEDLKLAGAAVNALAATDDPAALEELWWLQRRITHRSLVKQLDTALVAAAGRQGITPAQLVERSVPSHGLGPGAALERDLGGGHRARLAVEEDGTVRLGFVRPDGQQTRTAPAAVKDGFPDELKQAKALAKEVRGTVSGERARLEGLMSADREWPYDEWCRHYRDHPVTGVLVRRLIWDFQDADGRWHAHAPGAEPPFAAGRVRLWHPIRASVDDIRQWRALLVAEQLRQPFKQAFREIYLLTPAEEGTGGYSNRFAAHIVRYGTLYALFKERRWQANHLGPYDGGYEGEARGEFGDGGWRACFHHEPAAGDDRGGYAPTYAATDQVRFERREGRRWLPAPLAEVPPLVFSEAMRDVDLFVGVTSIAADPDWADRGEDRYTAYWHRTTFGELTEGAQVRRAALERILPRLKIAGRCSLDGRFLVVRGDLATYRIHLGSANILMEPGGSYLCIVPARREGGTVFLPFEDDRLSLIISKALLLAADARITDESVLRQIRRGA